MNKIPEILWVKCQHCKNDAQWNDLPRNDHDEPYCRKCGCQKFFGKVNGTKITIEV